MFFFTVDFKPLITFLSVGISHTKDYEQTTYPLFSSLPFKS
jgi:hypothetical protein